MTDTIRIRVMNLTHLPPEEAEKMWAELSPHMTLPFLMPGEELRYPPGATPPEQLTDSDSTDSDSEDYFPCPNF